MIEDQTSSVSLPRSASRALRYLFLTLNEPDSVLCINELAAIGSIPGDEPPQIIEIEAVGAIHSPMLILFPQLDPQNKPEGIEAIRAAIDQAGVPAESFVIAGVDHGFAVPGHPAHDSAAGPVEWRHALDFLATHLPHASATPD